MCAMEAGLLSRRSKSQDPSLCARGHILGAHLDAMAASLLLPSWPSQLLESCISRYDEWLRETGSRCCCKEFRSLDVHTKGTEEKFLNWLADYHSDPIITGWSLLLSSIVNQMPVSSVFSLSLLLLFDWPEKARILLTCQET